MIRKIVRIGNSDGVTIPVSLMRSYKMKIGDAVEVYVGKPGSSVKHLELLNELDKFGKNYRKALENLSKK